ncbi:hypothetical protein ACFWOL_25075, partial [Streptomyces sp. NPDC058442]
MSGTAPGTRGSAGPRPRGPSSTSTAPRCRHGRAGEPSAAGGPLGHEQFGAAVRELAQAVVDDGYRPDVVLGIARGGVFVPSTWLA